VIKRSKSFDDAFGTEMNIAAVEEEYN
jgi:hypothetical protein